MDSLDLIHNKIEKRRAKIEEILEKLNNINDVNKQLLQKIKTDFIVLFDRYDSDTLHIFTNYYNIEYEHHKEELNEDYIAIINRTHICKTLKDITQKLKSISESIIKAPRDLMKLVLECQHDISIAFDNKIDYKKCTCGTIKNTLPTQSELRCANCGETTILKGTVFEDPSTMDPNQQKRSDYDPTRHSDLWIDRILALRKVEFDQESLDIIKSCAKRDKKKNKESITCEYIRYIWKKYGYTQWNDDAPYARYVITECLPPPLTAKSRKRIRTEVIICMKIFDDIKGPDRSNALYYPYVIYKIICAFFVGCPEIKLLDSIHIQNDETLVYNDQKWREICKRRNRMEKKEIMPYEPTVVLESIF